MAVGFTSLPKREVLYSEYQSNYSLKIIAETDGQIRGLVSTSLSGEREVPVNGIPHHIDILDRKAILAAQDSLKECKIQHHLFHLLIIPKARGGGAPLEKDVDKMKTNKRNEADPLAVSLLDNIFTKGLPAVAASYGGKLPGIVVGVLTSTISSYLKNGGGAAIQAQLDKFEAMLNNDGKDAKEGYDNFVTYLDNFLSNATDRKTVVDQLYQDINAKKEQIVKEPENADRKLELDVLLDCVRLVSAAIPDKKVAHQVRMVGEASLSFVKAFQMVKQMGGIAAAGVGGMLGPIGLALSGVYCVYSLFSQASDQDPVVEVAEQIQKLANQASQLEITLNARADQLEFLIADFQWQAFEQFKQLNKGMTDLRTLSQTHYQSTNLKLDRISNYITAGLPAAIAIGLDTLKFNAKTKVQLGNLTPPEHSDFLIGFAGWAQIHSKNPIFTGALNISYAPEDVRDILRADTPEKLLYYLAHHPLCGKGGMNLANPYVWADAAEAYIQLRLSTPQYDEEYDKGHLPSFLGIYNTGLELMTFISDLQQNKALFQGLVKEYQTCLEQISKATSIDPFKAQLDACYHQLVTFSELAFPQSSKQDLIFSSYIRKRGNSRLRLVDSQDVQTALQEISKVPYEQRQSHLRRELFNDLQRTSTFFEEVIMQKVKEAHDSHPTITPMMQRLWDFGTRYFPNDPNFAPGTCPQVNAPHFTDTSRILPDDIFYAIFTGSYPAVERLVGKAHMTDGLGRTPLHYACITKQRSMIVKILGQKNVDVNAKDLNGDTAIYFLRMKSADEQDRLYQGFLRGGAHPHVDHWIPGEQEYKLSRKMRDRKETSEEGYRQLRIAAEKGHLAAQFEFGKSLLYTNRAEANKRILQAAEKGYKFAQFYIACRYMYGDGGFPQNDKEAINWFQKLEAQGGAEGSKFWLKKLLDKNP